MENKDIFLNSSILGADRLAIIFFAVLFSVIWRPILIFTVPGIIILFLPVFKKINITELIVYVIGVSIAFWVSSFWFLKYLPIKLTDYFWIIVVLSAVILLYSVFYKKIFYKITVQKHDFFLIFIFIFFLFLRLAPMGSAIVASGADMSMHTYITNLIVHANGVPQNYHPVLGADNFIYPAGFHTISALISLVSNVPAFRSTLLVTCLTYFLFSLFLFVFLNNYVPWEFSLISVLLFSFFTGNPQGFVGWGGNPTIFALGLFILFISFFENKDANKNKTVYFLAALILASVFLSHSVIFVQAAYAFGISFLVYFILAKGYKNNGWKKYAWIIAFLFLIIFPFLISFDRNIINPEATNWVKNWDISTLRACRVNVLNLNFWNLLLAAPLFIRNYIYGNFSPSIPQIIEVLLFFMGALVMLFKNTKKAVQYIVFVFISILLIMNTKYWILPFSYLIYPERVATMVIIPLSLFFSYDLMFLFNYATEKKPEFKKILQAGLFAFILAIAAALCFLPNTLQNTINAQTAVTNADMKAFNWIAKNTDQTKIILNNYGDAGLWIPSILFRPVVNPHPPLPGLKINYSGGKPEYLYIGKKCVYNCPIGAKDLSPSKYKLLYSQDGVYVYKIEN